MEQPTISGEIRRRFASIGEFQVLPGAGMPVIAPAVTHDGEAFHITPAGERMYAPTMQIVEWRSPKSSIQYRYLSAPLKFTWVGPFEVADRGDYVLAPVCYENKRDGRWGKGRHVVYDYITPAGNVSVPNGCSRIASPFEQTENGFERAIVHWEGWYRFLNPDGSIGETSGGW